MNITCSNKEYNWTNTALTHKKMYRCLYTPSIFKTIDWNWYFIFAWHEYYGMKSARWNLFSIIILGKWVVASQPFHVLHYASKVLINFLVFQDLFFRKRSFYSKGFIFEETVHDFKFFKYS